jgi:organic radical activating enzyme
MMRPFTPHRGLTRSRLRVEDREMPPRVGLKAHGYWTLARRNPWLLRCDEKVRNYLRYRLTPRRERIAPRTAGPVFLTLSITRRCNLSCRFCIVGDVINKPGWHDTEATLASTIRVMDHPMTRRCLYVMLTGGEPLLNRDAADIVRLLKSRHHLVGISTNGLHLATQADALRDAGLDVVNVSLYDENRAALAEAMPRVSRLLYCKLTKVIGRRDVEEPQRLEEAIRFARDIGCSRIFLQNTYPHVDGLAKRHETPLTLTPLGSELEPISDALATAYLAVQRDLARRYPSVRVSWPAMVVEREPILRKTCRMPWYIVSVDVAGNLAMCSAHASCTGPNLFATAPDDVMNSEPWISTRRGLLERGPAVPSLCVGCYTLTDPWRRDM